MTDWENYTRLCSMKDSVSSVCNSVQTNNFGNFHRFLFHYPLNFYGEDFVRDLYQTYGQIHFNPRINNIELLTDLNDTPPQLITSGMSIGGGVSGSWDIGGFTGVGAAIIHHANEFPHPFIINERTSSLRNKFVSKIKFTRRKRRTRKIK